MCLGSWGFLSCIYCRITSLIIVVNACPKCMTNVDEFEELINVTMNCSSFSKYIYSLGDSLFCITQSYCATGNGEITAFQQLMPQKLVFRAVNM